MNAPLPVGLWPGRGARHGASRAAVQDRDRTVSYAELDQRSETLADRLRSAGLGRGDRVATVTLNSVDHVVAFFACAKAGLILAPLSWRAGPTELEGMLDDARPSLVATDHDHLETTRRACAALPEPPVVALLGPAGIETEVPSTRGAGGGSTVPEPDDPVLLLYSSGSTGRPKGVLLSHASCWWTNQSLGARLRMTENDVVLVVLPQFHVAAWNVQPLLGWLTGSRVVLEPTFEPDRVLALVPAERITMMMGVPTTYLRVAEQPGFADVDLASLRLAQVGGAPTPEPLAAAWRRRGVPLVTGYGLTEAGPNVLCQPEADDGAGEGMVPYPGVEVALRDQSGALDTCDRGELVVRGRNVFVGYWGKPAETARALEGGWLGTGDIAERVADGSYRLVGRSSSMYISGGENVHPAEVERALLRHPDVAAAAVVGVPDPRWGEVGLAYVVPRPGARVDSEHLRDTVREHLAGFKVPSRVVVVGSLPLTGSGKIDRSALLGRAENPEHPQASTEPSEDGQS